MLGKMALVAGAATATAFPALHMAAPAPEVSDWTGSSVGADLLQRLAQCSAPATTSQLMRETGYTKVLVNQTLYALLREERVKQTPGSPPQWSSVPLAPDSAGVAAAHDAVGNSPCVLVVVDLGCCHDVLPQIRAYAERGEVEVRAYADLAFNGFGVSPPVKCANYKLFHATTADRNSADVALIWETSRLAQQLEEHEPERELHVFVCTKDLQFQSLKELVEKNPRHSLTFCTDWSALRCHIEE